LIIATLDNSKDALDLPTLERQIEAQASSKKVGDIIRVEYKDVIGSRLKVEPPEMFGPLMTELERIAKGAAPDWPPPEPPAV
jgi:hypothetical protein